MRILFVSVLFVISPGITSAADDASFFRNAFDAGFPNSVAESWDSYPAGTIIPNGTSLNGITYHASNGMSIVTMTFFPTSGANGLGRTPTEFFQPLDSVTFSFDTPISAFGIDVNTFSLENGSYSASTNTGIVVNSVFDPFPGASTGQFIGFSAIIPFTAVTITGGTHSYTLDTLRVVPSGDIVLDVPPFKQSATPWGPTEYDGGFSQSLACGQLMSQCGCATTAVAMTLAYFGVMQDPLGHSTTPQRVNDYFKGDQQCGSRGCVSRGYSYGSVVWTAADQYSMDAHSIFGTPIVQYSSSHFNSFDANVIRSDLENANPVIISEPGHFIVATGTSGNTFTINDPGFDWARLDDPAYNNSGLGLRRYAITNTDLSSIVVSTPAPTEILITDPNGDRTGYESTISLTREDIPHSSYGFEPAIADASGASLPPALGAGVHMAIITNPIAGRYTIELLSQSIHSTDYSFSVHSYSRDADLTLNLFDGEAGEGDTRIYEFIYDPASEAQGMTLITPIDVSPGELPNSINPRRDGVIPVAIMTTSTFDATTVDPTTVRFGSVGSEARAVRFVLEDVDRDGRRDMMMFFLTNEVNIACGQDFATLTGSTSDKKSIQGTAPIVTIGGSCR